MLSIHVSPDFSISHQILVTKSDSDVSKPLEIVIKFVWLTNLGIFVATTCCGLLLAGSYKHDVGGHQSSTDIAHAAPTSPTEIN